VFTYSGRPVSATVTGDANQDGNNTNNRLPGVSRNFLVGPDYVSTDLRISRRLYSGDRIKIELTAESFNLLNAASLFKPLRLLESTSFRQSAGCPRASFGPPTHACPARR
jgi:hypothetical protein